MHAGKRRHRSRCADEMKILSPAKGCRSDRRAIEALQHAGHLARHGLEHVGRDIAAAMTLRQRDNADRQRGPVGDMVGKPVGAIFADADDGNL